MSRPKPETPSSSPRPPESYGLGLGLGIFLSLWVTGFGLKAIFDTDLTGQEWLSLVLVGFSGAGALAVYRDGRMTASYVHFYFPSNPQAVAALLKP